jgi:hypothetical protein
MCRHEELTCALPERGRMLHAYPDTTFGYDLIHLKHITIFGISSM